MLGDNASGSKPIAGAGLVDFRLPDDDGEQVGGYEAPPVRPQTVALNYALDLSRDGEMSGDLTVTFYLAGNGENLWASGNQLGEAISVDVGRTAQTLSGTLELNQAQIDAMISGQMVIGARLKGDVSGEATIS